MVLLDIYAQTNNVDEVPLTKRWDSGLLHMIMRAKNHHYATLHKVKSIIILANKSKKHHESQASEPPRITSNVKQNLRFLKLWKSFQNRNSATPRPSTSYRKKKVEKDEDVVDTDLYRDPTSSLY
ncbi:unnamed protein product [Sphenostylis stenocarpa]|uniref:Uncharacterized protein n=1 Tax=Sphenostylis stenocarpa TaxID=92480 RepID=A0AA86S4P1_9FABA|nr:unnamed protein product [Sphenostylis stenocarpa]